MFSICFQYLFKEQEDLQQLNGNNTTDSNFSNIWQKVVAQFLESNLSVSTVHGSGFGRPFTHQDSGSLKGPPIVVQVITVAEIFRPNQCSTVKLKLSDGEHISEAVLHPSLLASRQLDFDGLKLGYKVSNTLLSD